MKKRAKHAKNTKTSSKNTKVRIHPATKTHKKTIAPVCASCVSHKGIIRAAWAGLISLLLSLMIAYMGTRQLTTKGQLTSYLVIICIATIFSIIYMFGYAKLGKLAKEQILKTSSYLFIALTVIDVVYLLILTVMKRPEDPYASAVFLFLYGALSIMFGKGVWNLKDKLGRLAKATGVLNIASGILTLTVILAPIGILLALFTELFNISTLFKAAQKYA